MVFNPYFKFFLCSGNQSGIKLYWIIKIFQAKAATEVSQKSKMSANGVWRGAAVMKLEDLAFMSGPVWILIRDSLDPDCCFAPCSPCWPLLTPSLTSYLGEAFRSVSTRLRHSLALKSRFRSSSSSVCKFVNIIYIFLLHHRSSSSVRFAMQRPEHFVSYQVGFICWCF